MIAGIQTFGELVHFHPHIQIIATDGGFTPDGTFVSVPKTDNELLLARWQTKVSTQQTQQARSGCLPAF